jgi:hypothetical protein
LVPGRQGPEVHPLNFGESLSGQLLEVPGYPLGIPVFWVLEREADGVAQGRERFIHGAALDPDVLGDPGLDTVFVLEPVLQPHQVPPRHRALQPLQPVRHVTSGHRRTTP